MLTRAASKKGRLFLGKGQELLAFEMSSELGPEPTSGIIREDRSFSIVLNGADILANISGHFSQDGHSIEYCWRMKWL